MTITFQWRVPGQVTNGQLADAEPFIQKSRDGLTGVITRVPYAVIGTDSEDGTTASISHSVPLGEPNPDSFTPVATIDPNTQELSWSVTREELVAYLEQWLFSACASVPDGIGALNKADQESQVAKKIRDQQSSQSAMAIPSAGQ